jgi:arylsulfatase A-like enzyme
MNENRISRRHFLRIVGAGIASLALPGYANSKVSLPGNKAAKRPNIVFILVDDMGWMDIGANGSRFYETPNVDKLAGEGMRFTQAYAASPICSPTRASILTGKNPARINLTQWIGGPGNPDYVKNLPLKEVLLPEELKPAGYTNGFFGKWHLNNRAGEVKYWPQEQGFDTNVAGHWRGGLYIPNKFFSPWNIPNIENGPDGEYITDRLAQEATNFIEDNKDNPFLVYLSFYTVHAPFNAPEDRVEKYEQKKTKLGLTDEERFDQENAAGKTFKYRKAQDHPTYAAMVESMDMAVGTVLDKVKKIGLEDNTIVFFFSDNGGLSTSEGTPTANTPLRAGKGWLYEGGIREPAIIKWPGQIKPGTVSDAVITSMDFYPTILEMAGLPLRPDLHVDGKSLVPLLRQQVNQVHVATYFHYPHRSNQRGTPCGAIRVGDYKLINFFSDNKLELYNLKDDIGETNNLADTMPELRDSLLGMLHGWWDEVGARFPKGYTRIPNIPIKKVPPLPHSATPTSG